MVIAINRDDKDREVVFKSTDLPKFSSFNDAFDNRIRGSITHDGTARLRIPAKTVLALKLRPFLVN